MEALMHPNLINFRNIVRYEDLLTDKGILKRKQELEEQGIEMEWYTHMQICTRYEKDAKSYHFE